MEKLRKLIRENFPGYEFSHINQYYRPGRNWFVKYNGRMISSFKQPYIYKKIMALNASRIGIIIIHKETFRAQYQEVNIITAEPTL